MLNISKYHKLIVGCGAIATASIGGFAQSADAAGIHNQTAQSSPSTTLIAGRQTSPPYINSNGSGAGLYPAGKGVKGLNGSNNGGSSPGKGGFYDSNNGGKGIYFVGTRPGKNGDVKGTYYYDSNNGGAAPRDYQGRTYYYDSNNGGLNGSNSGGKGPGFYYYDSNNGGKRPDGPGYYYDPKGPKGPGYYAFQPNQPKPQPPGPQPPDPKPPGPKPPGPVKPDPQNGSDGGGTNNGNPNFSGTDNTSPNGSNGGGFRTGFNPTIVARGQSISSRIAIAQGKYDVALAALAAAEAATPNTSSKTSPVRYGREPGDIASCGCPNADTTTAGTPSQELVAAKAAEAEAAAELAAAKAEARQFLESIKGRSGESGISSPIW